MTMRARWIAGSVMATLLVAMVLTLMPVRSEALASTPVHAESLGASAELDECALQTLDAILASREFTPVMNVFGLSQLRDVSLNEVTFKLGLDEQCPAATVDWKAISGVQSSVTIGHPACGDDLNKYWIPYADNTVDISNNWIMAACDGDVLLWTNGSKSESVSQETYNTGLSYPLSSTGLIASDTWCLNCEGGMSLMSTTESTVMHTSVATQDTNNMCVTLKS